MPQEPTELRVVPLGPLQPEFETALRDALAARYPAPVTVHSALEPPPETIDAARGQARADLLLDALAGAAGSDGARLLGLIDADLFAPGRRYVLGEAIIGGCAAVVGLARLRPEFHGEPTDPRRFFRRALVEALHEIGHMDGLGHCPDPACVMHFSEDLADTDRKGPGFCPVCAR